MSDTTAEPDALLRHRPDELLRHHGDVEVESGFVDFAVNVRGDGPPAWLRDRLATALSSLGSYPSAAAEYAAREQVAAHHGRSPDEVLLLSGGAEGFSMLPRLEPSLAATIHPSFTEPDWVLEQAGVPVHRVVLPPPFELDPMLVPDAADMVIIGNPTNPTSVLHPCEAVLSLRRPGRTVVVDEAFADAVLGAGESVSSQRSDDVVVLRSLTKTWALAGLRCGYALGHPDVLTRMQHGRAHWPLGSLQIEAIRACTEPFAIDQARAESERIDRERSAMIGRLGALGLDVTGPARAPFLLVRFEGADLVRERLRTMGIAVRRGDTFPGLDRHFLRVAVRDSQQVDILVNALSTVL
ncbi:threonine-phosphate decarboxylase [Rhodococcoides fascians A21d2]|uniref:Rv2231c family pyridoxal phosphate-dependent protein CobC n=1 Tax=Nocardiaceae TaxID=85025 RepID=UPI00068C50D4|nr:MULTISPECIES: Rv2231c family pyridoxal phosphate-dependent protein CobC [Rhodococcus]OZE76024.1 pyridoxal phosphate-dependent aminotransferase [Rhodococcus sp. 15-649-2-2]QII01678.1 threonine-phosphate decarboxylase [Rhodococcus fascians A21d2]